MKAAPLGSNRVFRFYAVGLLGVVVQLTVLGVLTLGLSFNYLISTAVAVEIAVIHNFFWHERWTWCCRTSEPGALALRLRRFCKFNFSTGIVSIATNLLVTRRLVEIGGTPYLIANLIAILSSSAVTFLLGEMFVFRPTRPYRAGAEARLANP